uniref:Uncharacterized protein n=1 Tax=Nothobranchius rachovii TaxID=451742 RepID=A0A1A8NBE7_9TELE
MWTNAINVWSALIWILSLIFHRPAADFLQYTAAELLRIRHRPGSPPASLHLDPDISRLLRRRYVHRCSRRNFHYHNSASINSFWSTTRRHPHRNSYRRTADHSSLASLARTANAHGCDSTTVNFGLLNIRSLTGKSHLIHDLIENRGVDFMCLCETWQQPADFSQLNDATPPGFVYLTKPCAEEVSR